MTHLQQTLINRPRFLILGWLLIHFFALAVLPGCGSKPLEIAPELGAPPASSRVTFKKVQFLSKPAGAHIEINRAYVGDAPTTVEIPAAGRNFTMNTTIRALPSQSVLALQYIQTRFFPRGAIIPQQIVFDMGIQHPVHW